MKKFGFTLAEVLITLGIVGVTAALVVPAVVNKVQVNMNMSRLSRTVEDLENAFTTAITVEHVSNILYTSFWPEPKGKNGLKLEKVDNIKRFDGEFSKYMKFTKTSKTPTNIYNGKKIYTLADNGSQGSVVSSTNTWGKKIYEGYPIILPNGAVAFLELVNKKSITADNSITESVALQNNTSMLFDAGRIMIDINGADAPNTFGRDIFLFFVGQNGHLYPYGGHDYAGLQVGTGKKDAIGSSWRDPSGTYTCLNNEKSKAKEGKGKMTSMSSAGLSCTARVVDEGYKMTY